MLWNVLCADLAGRLGKAAADVLLPQSRLLRHGGFLLLDGLDEVPEAGFLCRMIQKGIQ